MIVYPAGKTKRIALFLALQAAGVPFLASWLTWPFNGASADTPTQEDWAKHSSTCLREAAEADVVLLVAFEDDRLHFGALVEAGAALAAGKRVFLVSPHEWPFIRHHPRCRSFATLADAIVAIMAGAAGDKGRREKYNRVAA